MNTEILLTEQQEQNRVILAHQIYINEKIEKLNAREYLVKEKYVVEDLTTKGDISAYCRCSCPDHKYRGVECKHILAIQFYIMKYGA